MTLNYFYHKKTAYSSRHGGPNQKFGLPHRINKNQFHEEF